MSGKPAAGGSIPRSDFPPAVAAYPFLANVPMMVIFPDAAVEDIEILNGCEDVPRLFERISGLAPAGLEIKRIAIEFEDRTLSGLIVEVTEDAAGRRKWKAFL